MCVWICCLSYCFCPDHPRLSFPVNIIKCEQEQLTMKGGGYHGAAQTYQYCHHIICTCRLSGKHTNGFYLGWALEMWLYIRDWTHTECCLVLVPTHKLFLMPDNIGSPLLVTLFNFVSPLLVTQLITGYSTLSAHYWLLDCWLLLCSTLWALVLATS